MQGFAGLAEVLFGGGQEIERGAAIRDLREEFFYFGDLLADFGGVGRFAADLVGVLSLRERWDG